jgi:hypothetical protein
MFTLGRLYGKTYRFSKEIYKYLMAGKKVMVAGKIDTIKRMLEIMGMPVTITKVHSKEHDTDLLIFTNDPNAEPNSLIELHLIEVK